MATKEDEEIFEALIDMFASDGWKYFIETKTQRKELMLNAAPNTAISNDQWQYCRGELNELSLTLGYENFVKAVWEEDQKGEIDVDPL